MEFLTENQKEVLLKLRNIFPNKDVNSLVQIIAQYEARDETWQAEKEVIPTHMIYKTLHFSEI